MLIAVQDLPEDLALLKAMIADLQAENAKLTATVRAHDLVVQALRLLIAKLKKQAFGKSSEKIEREIEQLELALEDILVAAAQAVTLTSDVNEDEIPVASTSARGIPASRSRATWPAPFVMAWAVGRPSHCSSTTGASPSTTMPLSEP